MKTFTAFALREMGSQQRLVESSLCVCECLLGVSSLSGSSFSSCLKTSSIHKGYPGHVCKRVFAFSVES